MFRLLLAAALLLSLSFLGLSAAAAALGRAQLRPDDQRAELFGLCEGRPCFYGLTPGHSAWEEVRRALTGLPGDQISDKQAIFALAPGEEAQFFRSVDTVALGRVFLALRRPLEAGWVLARFGAPCGLSIYTGANLLTLRYPDLLANVQLGASGRLDSHMAVLSLQFHDPAFKLDMQPDLCIDNITDGARNHLWKGFAPLWSYAARPRTAG